MNKQNGKITSRLIVKNLPKYLDEISLKKRFETYGEVSDCRIMFKGNKNRGFAYIGYLNKDNANEAYDKLNNTYIDKHKIKIEFSSLKQTKKGENNSKQQNTENDFDCKRVFVKNFPYSISENQLQELFEEFGEVEAVKILRNRNYESQGLGFITYADENSSILALSKLDNTIQYGRILHVQQCLKRTDKQKEHMEELKQRQVEREKSSFKKLKKQKILENLEKRENWNSFFLNPNTVIEKVAESLNMNKQDMFDTNIENPAAVQAMAEHQIIQETRDYLFKNNINLKVLDQDPETTERSKTIIFVKNLPYQTKREKLLELFSRSGKISQLFLPENKAIGIVEFINQEHAKNAFEILSNYRFQACPLYLEWAPNNIFNSSVLLTKRNKQNVVKNNEEQLSKTIFVKNLNFETDEGTLKQFLTDKGCKSINTLKIVQKDGVSSGFGFVEFQDQTSALFMMKNLQNSILNKHVMQLSYSKPKKIETKKNKSETKNTNNNNKLIIRNIAFQANKSELKDLISNLISYRKLRLPKKLDGEIKGYAFVEFNTSEECQKGFEIMRNLHFYGRKLAIEYANNQLIKIKTLY